MVELCYNCLSPSILKKVEYDGLVFCSPDCFFNYMKKQSDCLYISTIRQGLRALEDERDIFITILTDAADEYIEDIRDSIDTFLSPKTIKSFKKTRDLQNYLKEIRKKLIYRCDTNSSGIEADIFDETNKFLDSHIYDYGDIFSGG